MNEHLESLAHSLFYPLSLFLMIHWLSLSLSLFLSLFLSLSIDSFSRFLVQHVECGHLRTSKFRCYISIQLQRPTNTSQSQFYIHIQLVILVWCLSLVELTRRRGVGTHSMNLLERSTSVDQETIPK